MCNVKLETNAGILKTDNAIVNYFRANAPLIAHLAEAEWDETEKPVDLRARTPEWIHKMVNATILHWNSITATQYKDRWHLTEKETSLAREVISVYLRHGIYPSVD